MNNSGERLTLKGKHVEKDNYEQGKSENDNYEQDSFET